MQKLETYIAGVLSPNPDNIRAFEIELSFEDSSPEAVINATDLIFKGENASKINAVYNAGGIFEGIPLVFKICDTGDVVFDGIIDLTDSATKFNCDIVHVKIRDKRMDMIKQLFDSIGFDFLATPPSKGGPGIINPLPISAGGDYAVVPYQINHLPDYLQVMSLGLVIYDIAEKIKDIIHKLVSHFTGLAAPGIGALVLNIILIVGYVLYLVAMIIIIFELLLAAFDNLISPVYTKLGMYALTICQKACQYFNVGFSSSWLTSAPFNNMIILPEKPAWPQNSSLVVNLFNNFLGGSGSQNRRQYDDLYNLTHPGTNGSLAYGYMDGTVGDFFRALADTFNCKAKIILDALGNPTLHFERWDYVYDLSQYQMPNISEQAPFPQAISTNASEIAANYKVKFALDPMDENTYDNYQGTLCMATTRPITYSVLRNVTLKNLEEKELIFAHATRKDRDTVVEEILKPVWALAAAIANPVIGLINGIIGIVNTVNGTAGTNLAIPAIPTINPAPAWSQTGHMLLTSHTTSRPKIFIAGTKTSNTFYGYAGVQISPSNRSETQPSLAASMLMKYFHFSNLPLTVNPGPPYTIAPAGSEYFNQYVIYKGQKIPVCCADYHMIKNNNIAKTYGGQDARIDKLPWRIFNGTALIDYRINKKFTSNLKVTYIIDGVTTKTVL